MSKKINVLIFPAGEINSIELHDALSTCVNIKVFGASSVERHGKYVFKNYIGDLPNIKEVSFFYEFNNLIEENSIDVVFPTHDTVATFLADNEDKFSAKLIAGDAYTSQICRSKLKTYNLFSDCEFIPKKYDTIENITSYPIFIKPDEGQGSVGTKLINERSELEDIIDNNLIMSEYLPGEEYTVDCLTDKNGNLQFISPRSRDRLLAGVCVAGKTEPLTFEIETIAKTINSRLKFLGLWFFQIKKDINGLFKLLEISTRCAGTMCLTRARGVNLPLLSVYCAMGFEINVLANRYNVTMDRTLISRYFIDYEYDTVYFDLDDTLIVNGEVNLNAIRFLFQCKNKNKDVILLSKHQYDINETLFNYAISKELFTSIIHIKPEASKKDYINSENAIFIDNAFSERKNVFDNLGIPVFDVDGIEVLLDWRC